MLLIKAYKHVYISEKEDDWVYSHVYANFSSFQSANTLMTDCTRRESNTGSTCYLQPLLFEVNGFLCIISAEDSRDVLLHWCLHNETTYRQEYTHLHPGRKKTHIYTHALPTHSKGSAGRYVERQPDLKKKKVMDWLNQLWVRHYISSFPTRSSFWLNL